MKTYKQLTPEQQQAALDRCLNDLLTRVTEGSIRFCNTPDSDDLQSRIDAAQEKADAMQTPWFAHEYIMDTCRKDLTDLAQCQAEDSMYSEDSDGAIIHGIVVRFG